ncbi:unnamed protein product [Caenorhabditis brenneri]
MTEINEKLEYEEEDDDDDDGDELEEDNEEGVFISIWNHAWNRSYIMMFVLCTVCLATNTWDINRNKYDGKRIIPENVFNMTNFLKKKNSGPCGWMSAKFGVYGNRSCSGSVLVPLRDKYGCFLSECGEKNETLCGKNGWISKDISTEKCLFKNRTRNSNIKSFRCPSNDMIRHYCCRPLTHLCTWQGIWVSVKKLQNINCQFEADEKCGRIVCDNGEHIIYTNSEGRCRSVVIHGILGEAKCGQIRFPDNSDAWYKKVDGYATLNS